MAQPPLDLAPLLPQIDRELITLFGSLSPEEWKAQTIARFWKVKDVAAHLLDGNLRVLSMLRDGYYDNVPEVHSYEDLLRYLNGLNADWVQAMKRLSPQMLLLLHEVTGPLFCSYYASLDPFGVSPFAVAWAGEAQSFNWMHIAREYTEKWLHQQQIRDAVNRPGLMNRTYFYPFIQVFMYGLPHTYRSVEAEEGVAVQVIISSEIGGSWWVQREEAGWKGKEQVDGPPAAVVEIEPDLAWKLFSKSIRPEDVAGKVRISGSEELGKVALSMVSVMA